MPTIGSETYRSVEKADVTKDTYPSREPTESIPGPDYPVLTITSLTPDSLAIGGEDAEVVVEGEKLTPECIIVWNGGDEPTAFIDSEHVSTIVKPSTVTVDPPFALPVLVRVGEVRSNSLEFTFVAEEARSVKHGKK